MGKLVAGSREVVSGLLAKAHSLCTVFCIGCEPWPGGWGLSLIKYSPANVRWRDPFSIQAQCHCNEWTAIFQAD